MRVLHVVPSFAPAWRYGGPIQSVLRLCQALQRAGVEVEVATTDCDGPGDLNVPRDTRTEFEGVPVTYHRRWPRIGYAPSATMAASLLRGARTFDLIHITSTFSFAALAGARVAQWEGLPYVISPRGSLQTWGLQQKRWKKLPYWRIVERGNLSRAAAVHVTSEVEREELLRILPGAPTFLVPNGIEEPPAFEARRAESRLLFLGRLHPKKGLDVLVRALSLVSAEYPDLETIVAGPDDVGEWSRVEQLLSCVSPRPRVNYVGAVQGLAKWRMLSEATAFVLPSHSENFGQAVVEALASGTPAVVSRNCPWAEVEESGAGAWVENTPEAFADGIRRVLRASDPQRMRDAARGIAARYRWGRLGVAMQSEYLRILDARR